MRGLLLVLATACTGPDAAFTPEPVSRRSALFGDGHPANQFFNPSFDRPVGGVTNGYGFAAWGPSNRPAHVAFLADAPTHQPAVLLPPLHGLHDEPGHNGLTALARVTPEPLVLEVWLGRPTEAESDAWPEVTLRFGRADVSADLEVTAEPQPGEERRGEHVRWLPARARFDGGEGLGILVVATTDDDPDPLWVTGPSLLPASDGARSSARLARHDSAIDEAIRAATRATPSPPAAGY